MDFVSLLEKELHRRIASNPTYSVRAYARDLKTDQSALTKILSRTRPVSDKFIKKTAPQLNLTSAEAKAYLKPKNIAAVKQYLDLEYEKFTLTSDWYHDALLELIDTEGFKPDSKWISKRLNVNISLIKQAIQRLKKVGLLEVKNDKWIDKSKVNSLHPSKKESLALKNYQKQILKKSVEAIEEHSQDNRSHTSIMFSASNDNIAEAKKLITKFRKDIAALMRASNQSKSEVYQLQVGLFPISKNEGESK